MSLWISFLGYYIFIFFYFFLFSWFVSRFYEEILIKFIVVIIIIIIITIIIKSAWKIFINALEANCYLQVKIKKKELLKPIYNSFR